MRKHLVIAALAIAAALAGQNQAKAQTSTPAISSQEVTQELSARRGHRHSHRHRKTHHRRSLAHSGRPSAWCGWYLARYFGMSDRRLWLAREWANVGRPVGGPAPGVIAVYPHHVGVVVSVPGPGRIVLRSGNDGHAVRVRERTSRGVIAWRSL